MIKRLTSLIPRIRQSRSIKYKMSDQEVTEVTEGLAKCEAPKFVFYNPVQEFNRDLTIAVISEQVKYHFANDNSLTAQAKRRKKRREQSASQDGSGDKGMDSEAVDVTSLQPGKYYDNGIKIFEGLAASGLRSIRFGLEIPGVKQVVANDFNDVAVEFIEKNIAKNDLAHLVKSRLGDAAMGMYEHRSKDDRFDVIDLDPYGSPHLFLDAAVQAIQDGGLLCITCTDAAVLCGNAPEKCNANYGSVPLKAPFQHEMGIRIILQCLDSHANRYSRYIVPLLSLSIDFYFRVFVRVYTGQREVKHSITKKSMVYSCVGCKSHDLQPLAEAIPTKGEGNFKFLPGLAPAVGTDCPACGQKYRMGGPVWNQPLHDTDFVSQVIKRVSESNKPPATKARILGMLGVVVEELPDVPLYYVLDNMCNVVHCLPPKMTMMRSAILNAGYRVSMSHAKKNSYKTDAPAQFLWDILKEWMKDNPVHQKRMEDELTRAILDKPQVSEINFEEHIHADPQSRKSQLKRFPPNPEPNWGPKPKAIKREDNLKLTEDNAEVTTAPE